MRVAIIALVLILAGCDSTVNSSFQIRNGQLLLDGIARECKGELTIVFKMSGDVGSNEISATCVQTGPIDGSVIEPVKETQK